MPLFELFRKPRSKPDTTPASSPVDPSPAPERDFLELAWESGQILGQGQSQSSRARRSGFNQSLSQTSNWSEAETRQKGGKFRSLEFEMGELAAAPSGEIDLGQDDDVVPWLSYPFNGSLHSDDFSSDLLPELPGIAGVADGGQPLVCKNSDSMRLLENFIEGEVTVARAGPTQPAHLNPSSAQQQQQQQQSRSLFSPFRSRFQEDAGRAKSMATEDQGRAEPVSAFCSFPCFSRPVGLFGPVADNPKASVPDHAPPDDLNFAGSRGVKQLEDKHEVETVIVEVSDALPDRTGEKDGQTGCAATEARGITAEGDKNVDHGTSSVCSGNTVERDACNPKHWSKRKSRDNDESDAPSESTERGRSEQLEDVDGEPAIKKEEVPSSSRGTTSKKSKAAEVHNLSERRRRDRINEKMRTLQELIPNCNKANKASMLDEAIEYLKTLQLQVQMMTMGAGLYMPPMMLPTGIHMPHFPHMGFGMGLGIGFGGMGLNASNSVAHRPMVHIPPPMTGVQFPAMHHRMLPEMFGYPGHGIPSGKTFHPIQATSVVTSVGSGHGVGPATAVSSSKKTGPRTTTPMNTNPGRPEDQPTQDTNVTYSVNRPHKCDFSY